VPKLKKDNSYLTIPQGKNQLIPFYFEKEQAVAHLEAFKKAKPQEAANTEIQVLDLYRVIETLSSSNDPSANKIFLFPSRESIEFIRSIVPNQPKK
jgi:nickel transport protein